MFKHRKKRQDENTNDDDNSSQQPHEDFFGTLSKPTAAYKPLDEINLTRDFRASLILNQFNEAEKLSSLTPTSQNVLHNSNVKKALTTPPLSPSSSTSELFGRPSSRNSSSSKNNSEHGPLNTWQHMVRPMIKGDDFQDIASGPPIIPVSRTPPPPPAVLEQNDPYHKKNKKSIFDSDDDEEDPINMFFNDFSVDRPKSRRISTKKYHHHHHPSSTNKKLSRFDLAAFANHLHENRLSMIQVRESKYIRLTEDEERELVKLLEKRKSMVGPLPTDTSIYESNEDEKDITPAVLGLNIHDNHHQPERPLTKKPSVLRCRVKEQDAREAERKRSVRKSLSMDALHQLATMDDDAFRTASTMEPVKETTTSTGELLKMKSGVTSSMSAPLLPKFVPEKQSKDNSGLQPSSPQGSVAAKPSPSPKTNRGIGLFGSLRQASRNTPFRGLVRSLSSAGAYRGRYSNNGSSSTQEGGMSPAAMAVMQHDKDVQEKKQVAARPKETATGHHDGGLLTHLLVKAGKEKRTKTVNMALGSQRKENTKSRIVRRTIIYVPPDSINFMKTLEKQQLSAGLRTPAPPLPQDTVDKIKQFDKKPSRSSIKDSAGKETMKQRQDAESVLNYYDDESLYDYYQDGDSSSRPELQGLELREMDDGTVEWGIVKKQGNRKSFYMQGDESVEHNFVDENDKKIEEHLLALMRLERSKQQQTASLSSSTSQPPHSPASPSTPPPVPRRSPRRRINSGEDHRRPKHISTIHSSKDASTTDVYFAPQQTLPSLLQMITDSVARDQQEAEKSTRQPSIEEQLDEVMKSFQHVQ